MQFQKFPSGDIQEHSSLSTSSSLYCFSAGARGAELTSPDRRPFRRHVSRPPPRSFPSRIAVTAYLLRPPPRHMRAEEIAFGKEHSLSGFVAMRAETSKKSFRWNTRIKSREDGLMWDLIAAGDCVSSMFDIVCLFLDFGSYIGYRGRLGDTCWLMII